MSVAQSEFSFHRFAKDSERCRQWVRNLKLKNFTPKEHSRICSQHFDPECFNRTLDVIRLRENAFPTIFKTFSPHLQEDEARTNLKRKSPMERHSSSPKVIKTSSEPALDIRLLQAQNNVELDHSYGLSSAQNIKKKLQ
ncbi:THAP domain-containing protein 1-like [Lepeophtheirus salmonis]|uniref:THAP domain-containing protein 1-like n=1 Tax=Lepeophtheirus salmonis TaxID=72036 RepID=UPI001AE42BA7|nr:THAP domain-containing protein 1-like [Lepeophtheirus salmonis]